MCTQHTMIARRMLAALETAPKSTPVEEEPKPWDLGAIERCCMCRVGTRYWTRLPDRTPGQQVAMCATCAVFTAPSAVPSKRDWCDKEEALTPPVFGRPRQWALR